MQKETRDKHRWSLGSDMEERLIGWDQYWVTHSDETDLTRQDELVERFNTRQRVCATADVKYDWQPKGRIRRKEGEGVIDAARRGVPTCA